MAQKLEQLILLFQQLEAWDTGAAADFAPEERLFIFLQRLSGGRD